MPPDGSLRPVIAEILRTVPVPPDPDSVSEGFRLLEQMLDIDPNVKVIVLTGQNDQANALRAISLGAYDFFAKPFEPELLGLPVLVDDPIKAV